MIYQCQAQTPALKRFEDVYFIQLTFIPGQIPFIRNTFSETNKPALCILNNKTKGGAVVLVKAVQPLLSAERQRWTSRIHAMCFMECLHMQRRKFFDIG